MENTKLPRIELLYKCLVAGRSFFDSFLLVHPDQYYNLPFAPWVQLAGVLMTVCRLLLFKCDGWDLVHAREVINFPHLLKQLVAQFTAAGKYGNHLEEENKFLRYAQMMRLASTNWQQKISIEVSATQDTQQSATVALDDQAMGDYLSLDDLFWQDFIGEWGTTN